jgi:hypothetical protein
MVKDRNKPEAPAASRLSLRHTYVSKSSVDVAGPSNFGGRDDQLVLCASKGALIRISSASPRTYCTHVFLQPEIFIFGIVNQEHCCTMSTHSPLELAT